MSLNNRNYDIIHHHHHQGGDDQEYVEGNRNVEVEVEDGIINREVKRNTFC